MVNPEDQYMISFVEFHWAKIKVKLSLHTSWKQKGSGGIVLIDCNTTEFSRIYVKKGHCFYLLV